MEGWADEVLLIKIMIAALNILTPAGDKQVGISFGNARDEAAMRSWRVGRGHSRPDLAADAIEFAKLAGKRWRYYLKRHEAAASLEELASRIEKQPKTEVGFMLVARLPLGRKSSLVGIAWCRRTWCNHIVLDFLAAHPMANDPAGGYKGVGAALILSLAAVAREIACPLVWGEATESSSVFYQKLLGGKTVKDYFFFDEAILSAQAAQLDSRSLDQPLRRS